MAANQAITPDSGLGAVVAPTIGSKQVREQVVTLGDVFGNVLKTTDNGDGTSTLATSGSGGSSTANQGTAAAVASAWPTKLVDSGGVNVASVSAAGAVKVDGSAATQPVSGTVAVSAVSGTVTTSASAPATANILVGTATTDGGTILTIPATRTWVGQILLSGSVTVAATSTGAIAATPNVTTTGATATPAATSKLAQLAINVPGNVATGITGTNANDAATISAVVVAGASSATLQLNFGSATAASATAVGALQ